MESFAKSSSSKQWMIKKIQDHGLMTHVERLITIGSFVGQNFFGWILKLFNVLWWIWVYRPRPYCHQYLPLYSAFQNKRHELLLLVRNGYKLMEDHSWNKIWVWCYGTSVIYRLFRFKNSFLRRFKVIIKKIMLIMSRQLMRSLEI
jgi:hypothetical protein